MKISTYRKLGWQSLAGNWTYGVLLCLLASIIAGLIGSLTGGFGTIIAGLIAAGVDIAFLQLVDGNKITNYFTALFSGFTSKRLIPIFLTWLLSTIFLCLWTILLIIPGIIKGLAYSQAYYIVKDRVNNGEELTPTQAITESRQLMDGHKWEFFLLQLSFIGWAILAIIPLGLGFLWLVPYVHSTNANYYRKLSANKVED